jgi:peptide/nickel transport system ATP-binding protein
LSPPDIGTLQKPAPLLDVRSLDKVFISGRGHNRKAVKAVDGVNLTVDAGQAVGLVGESGSGKSTVARLIARLLQPTSGRILLNGRDVLAEERRGASRQYRHEVQMIFQDPFSSLNPAHTVTHHLYRALRIHRNLGDRSPTVAVADLLDAVGLGTVPGIAGRFPHELSGGQRQRVAIARTLAAQPALIVADEPTSMLDVSVRVGILNLLDQLRETRRIGLLLITHDLASARYSTSVTLVMYAGYLLESGPSTKLIADPKHPYTQLLVSSVPRRTRPSSQFPEPAANPALADTSPQRRGCPFAQRCPHRMPVCVSSMPGVQPVGPGRWVRCHLYGPGQGSPEPSTAQFDGEPLALP